MEFQGHSEPFASSYEILYNTAFKQINAGNYAEAEKTLILCEKLCLHSCEEDGYSEEETEQEVAFIRCQFFFFEKSEAFNLFSFVEIPCSSVTLQIFKSNF